MVQEPNSDIDQKPGPGPTEPEINFAFVFEKLIQPKCLDCHSPGGKAEDLDFSSEEAIFESNERDNGFLVLEAKPEESGLYLSLLKTREERKGFSQMPPRSSRREVTPEEKEWLKLWIAGLEARMTR